MIDCLSYSQNNNTAIQPLQIYENFLCFTSQQCCRRRSQRGRHASHHAIWWQCFLQVGGWIYTRVTRH